MAYRFNLLASSGTDPAAAGHIKNEIRAAGGTVARFETEAGADGGLEHWVVVEVAQTNQLHSIVVAVDAVRGVGVVAVTESRPPRVGSAARR